MPRYIDADDIDNIMVFLDSRGCPKRIEAPTVDVAPVVHGHWERVAGGVHFPFRCSRCGEKADSNEYTHCHCGARMDEEVKKDVSSQ